MNCKVFIIAVGLIAFSQASFASATAREYCIRSADYPFKVCALGGGCSRTYGEEDPYYGGGNFPLIIKAGRYNYAIIKPRLYTNKDGALLAPPGNYFVWIKAMHLDSAPVAFVKPDYPDIYHPGETFRKYCIGY